MTETNYDLSALVMQDAMDESILLDRGLEFVVVEPGNDAMETYDVTINGDKLGIVWRAVLDGPWRCHRDNMEHPFPGTSRSRLTAAMKLIEVTALLL